MPKPRLNIQIEEDEKRRIDVIAKIKHFQTAGSLGRVWVLEALEREEKALGLSKKVVDGYVQGDVFESEPTQKRKSRKSK